MQRVGRFVAAVAVAAVAGAGGAQAGVPVTFIYDFDFAGFYNPNGGLVFDHLGHLWGTAASGSGTVFGITTKGKLLHQIGGDCVNFTAPGCEVNGGLAVDANGLIYGTAFVGPKDAAGTNRSPVFRISPNGAATIFSLLNPTKIGESQVGLTYYDGALYGINVDNTAKGAMNKLFSVTLAGKTQSAVNGPPDGLGFTTRVAFDPQGNIWALAPGDDTGGTSTFALADTYTVATKTWTHSLEVTPSTPCNTDPVGRPYIAADGTVFVTTQNNANTECDGATGGWLFKLPSGGSPVVLASFVAATQGSLAGGVVPDSAGALYGITVGDPFDTTSIVYCVTPAGNFVTLASFSNPAGGGGVGELVYDGVASFYGVTNAGGANGFGGVFKFTPGSACSP